MIGPDEYQAGACPIGKPDDGHGCVLGGLTVHIRADVLVARITSGLVTIETRAVEPDRDAFR